MDKIIPENLFNNHYITMIIAFGLIIYSSMIEKKLPKYYVNVFSNQFFKLFFLLFIFFIAEKDIKLAIILGIVYTVSQIVMTNNVINNNFSQLEHYIQLEHFTNDYAVDHNLF